MFSRISKVIYHTVSKILPKKRVGKWIFVTGICLVSPSPVLTLVSVEALLAASMFFTI